MNEKYNETIRDCAKIYTDILKCKIKAIKIARRENPSDGDMKVIRASLTQMEESSYEMLLRFFGQDVIIAEALKILIHGQTLKQKESIE